VLFKILDLVGNWILASVFNLVSLDKLNMILINFIDRNQEIKLFPSDDVLF